MWGGLAAAATVLMLLAADGGAEGPPRDRQAEADWVPSEITRVTVGHDGAIALDGRPASLGALKAECKRLKRADGAVEYSRAGDLAESPQAARAVARVLVMTEIPVRFVGPDGRLPAELRAFLPPTDR